MNILTPEKVLAVLVIYGQLPENTHSWQSLQATSAGKKLHWLIYDNSPVPPSSLPKDILYEHHPNNPGVSAAYLRAASVAGELGAEWLLLLDQDSIFSEDWFAHYEAAVSQHPAFPLFTPILTHGSSVLSPAPIRWGRTWSTTKLPPSTYNLRQFAPVNAGMLIRRNAYVQAGGHLPEVALDFSDFAFLFFFRKSHPEAILIKNRVEHQLSGVEKVPYEQRLSRYKLYCRDGLAFANAGGPKVALFGWMLWRALLLSIRYKRVEFFWVLLRSVNIP